MKSQEFTFVDDNKTIKSLRTVMDELGATWNSNPEDCGKVLKKLGIKLRKQREKDLSIAHLNYIEYRKKNIKSGEEYRCVGCVNFHNDEDRCMEINSPNYDVIGEIKLDCGECFKRKETRCNRCKYMENDFYTGNAMCRCLDNQKTDRENGCWIWAFGRYCGNCFEPK